MKIKLYALAFALFAVYNLHAQQFINKAVVEYEVKANIKKTMGNNVWDEMMKENLPTFKTAFYTFTFANNKSIYKFDHWAAGPKVPEWMRREEEDNVWYSDYSLGKFDMQKSIYGTALNIEDSMPALKWKLSPNENRVIAGFNCRKAVAVIFDSVYIFAFYTDEIMIPGGPCSINGLPGMILGVTIPRLYTSWIATKVMVNGVNESIIKPVSAKKNYNLKLIEATIIDRTKDWYSDDETENKEIKQQKARMLWQALL